MEITYEIYKKAEERAKTDVRLAGGLERLERLNRELHALNQQLTTKRAEYTHQEQAIADHMAAEYPEDCK